MQIIIVLVLALVGFVCGYFLQTNIVVGLSVISIGFTSLWLKKAQEMEGLVAMIFFACAIVANGVMWITWYLANDKVFIQEFVTHHILK
jgi:hypothetical protein